MKRRVLSVFLVIFIVSQSLAFGAVEIYKIGEKYKDKQPVKIYIGKFTNETGKNQITEQAFKKALEASIENRQSMSFDVVKTPGDSILQVAGVMMKYEYMHRGPFKVNPSVGGLLLETAATASHNYVEMMVKYTVTDTGTGKVVWERTLSDYIKKDMTPAESIPRIYDKITRDFLSKCFGKPK